MMKSKIKICGITSIEDARLAVELGADWLGFNFHRPSPRYLEPGAAAEIISQLSASVTTVAVTVNAGLVELKRILEVCPVDMIQLPGDETADQCRAVSGLGVGVIKAVRIGRPGDIEKIKDYPVETMLLDAFREAVYGGTGERFDWSWIRPGQGQRIFLAGGITADNIVEALKIGTYGIDLCSGVEGEPGRKDTGKMNLLFERIESYYNQR